VGAGPHAVATNEMIPKTAMIQKTILRDIYLLSIALLVAKSIVLPGWRFLLEQSVVSLFITSLLSSSFLGKSRMSVFNG
jgi:hypothetical protein